METGAAAFTQGERWPDGRSAIGFVVLVLAAISAGCATGSSPDETAEPRHEIPAEVTDHTVDSTEDRGAVEQPTVDVTLERGALSSVDPSGYEASLEERTIQCYRRTLEQLEGADRPTGSMVYQLVVTRNGDVAGTELMSTLVRRRELQRCVEYELGRLEFGIGERGRPLYRMTVRLHFRIETLLPEEPPV